MPQARITRLLSLVLWTASLSALAATGAAGAAAAPPAQPFTMNGWQFHDYDMPKLREAINKAPEYGVNFFIFSHQFFRSVDGFLKSSERQRDVLEAAALAQQKKIAVYIWVHEFDDIPDKYKTGRRVNFDAPELFQYLERRYDQLLAVVPGAAGLVVTFHESNNKIFRNSEVASKLPVPERLYRISRFFYDLCKKHNKQLIIRNFFYEPLEMDYFAAALARLPDDLVVMSKDTCHEFDPFYPPDPMHGKVGKKRQIIEFDLGVEKAWGWQGPYAQVGYIQKFAQRAKEKGLAGMVGRCRLMWDKPFENVQEVNLYAFSRFLKDPDVSAEQVWKDWAARRYPEHAAPYVIAALQRTEFINHNGRYFLGLWLTKSIGAEWNNYRYYLGHVLQRPRSKWSNDPADKALEEASYNPDEALFRKFVAEKDEVLKQVKASIADLDQAARYMTPAQMAPLREGFGLLLDAAKLYREWTRAYFAQRRWISKPNEQDAMVVEDALARLEAMDRAPGVTYGLNPETGHRYNLDHFVLEMRWRMKNRSRALEEDRRILDRIRETADVENR